MGFLFVLIDSVGFYFGIFRWQNSGRNTPIRFLAHIADMFLNAFAIDPAVFHLGKVGSPIPMNFSNETHSGYNIHYTQLNVNSFRVITRKAMSWIPFILKGYRRILQVDMHM